MLADDLLLEELRRKKVRIPGEDEEEGVRAVFQMFANWGKSSMNEDIMESKNEEETFLGRQQLSATLSALGISNNPQLVADIINLLDIEECGISLFAYRKLLVAIRCAQERAVIYDLFKTKDQTKINGPWFLEDVAKSFVEENKNWTMQQVEIILKKVADTDDDPEIDWISYTIFKEWMQVLNDKNNNKKINKGQFSLDSIRQAKDLKSAIENRAIRTARTAALHSFKKSPCMTVQQATQIATASLRVLLSDSTTKQSRQRANLEIIEHTRNATQNEIDTILLAVADGTWTRTQPGWRDEEAHVNAKREAAFTWSCIKRGANIHIHLEKSPHESILSKAISSSQFAAATVLLDAGSHPLAVDDDGATPLMRLVVTPQPPLKLLRRLLDEKQLINARRHDGGTALLAASSFGRCFAIQQLLERGADPNLHLRDLTSPLMRAAQYGFYESVVLLLQNGADLFATNAAGRSALDLAVLSARSNKLIDFLRDHGAKVSQGAMASRRQIDRQKRTPVGTRRSNYSSTGSPTSRSKFSTTWTKTPAAHRAAHSHLLLSP
uniref:Calmodulin n=1 Tax=Aureoumbra lagunensis TaxID=44058 RepID=A0A7S3JXM0_9STRA